MVHVLVMSVFVGHQADFWLSQLFVFYHLQMHAEMGLLLEFQQKGSRERWPL